jgi:glycosyltransferase involved in cell wall biosynthesis
MFLSSSPTVKGSSGYHASKTGKSPIIDKLAQTYNIKSFCWTKRRDQPISLKHVYLLDGFQIIWCLLCSLLNGRFNVVVTTGIPVLESVPTFIIAKLLRIPIIIKETHWYWPNTSASKFTWPINKLMVFSADLVICPGKRAFVYWRSLGIAENKITVVPFYASELERNTQSEKTESELNSIFENKIVILCFGRLIKKKGIDYLVNAFAPIHKEFRNAVLVIAGDGPERENLQHLCDRLELSNVIFAGAPQENVKSAYFSSSDIYVYPSITMELPEEWPLGVVEAMSVGKPVIVTTATGSAPDVVKQGINGYIIPEKDTAALYQALRLLITDKNLRTAMGLASKKIAEEAFSYNSAVEEFDKAIKTTVLHSKISKE